MVGPRRRVSRVSGNVDDHSECSLLGLLIESSGVSTKVGIPRHIPGLTLDVTLIMLICDHIHRGMIFVNIMMPIHANAASKMSPMQRVDKSIDTKGVLNNLHPK